MAKERMRRGVSVVLALLLAVSTAGATLCWIDRSQHKTNALFGEARSYSVTLHKYEKAPDGTVTEDVVPGAEFYLYKTGDPAEQIGGRYVTDADGKIAISDIAPGDYYFLETNPGRGYTYDRDGGSKIDRYDFNISSHLNDLEVTVHAYNIRLHGGFVIEKTVIGVETDDEFEFTVTFSDDGVYAYKLDGAGAEIPLASGGTIQLRHGQKAIFEGIPTGVTYTVVETPAEGYTTTSENHQGTITDEGAAAGFTNTAIAVPPGSLTVTKTVTGKPPDLEETFEFTVAIGDTTETITLAHGESKTYENLPLGTPYTITENDYTADGYITTPTEGYTGTVTGNHTLPFVNTYDDGSDAPGSLLIRKTVTGAETDKQFTFTVTIGDETETVTLGHGESKLYENIPAGAVYSVEETPDSEYRTSVNINGSISNTNAIAGAIAPDYTTEIEFINAQQPDVRDITLTVKKTVIGNAPAGYEDLEFSFVLAVQGREPEPFRLKPGQTAGFVLPAGAPYTVTETDIPAGWSLVHVTNGAGTAADALVAEFTNRYDGEILIDISGEKTWVYGNASVTLPEEITLRLKNGDTVVQTATVKPDASGKWTYTFTDIPKYHDGAEIKYTVEEIPVSSWKPGYNDDNLDVVNTYVPPAVLEAIPVEKAIVGGTPKTQARFRFLLTAPDGAPLPGGGNTVTVTGAGTGSFGGITYDTPGTYTYTISEADTGADGYTYDESVYALRVVVAEQGGALAVTSKTLTKNGGPADKALFTNAYESGDETGVRVTKLWQDDNAANRPGSVKVQLYRDGAAYGSPVVLNNGNGWTHTWSGLKKGPAWTVDEPDVPTGYTRTISGDAVNGFTITNSRKGGPPEPEKTSVKVTKAWADSGNPNRPASVKVQLYKDGSAQGNPVILSAGNKWTYTWTGLEKGPAWTVDEPDVPTGYTRTISGDAVNGFTITNRRGSVPPSEKITIRGSKSWDHRDNPAAKQPKSISLILYIKADGVIVRQREITAADHWSWSIQVDKYDENGREIVYTVDEARMDDYAKKVIEYSLQNDYYPGWNTDLPYPDKPYVPGAPGTPSLPKTDDTGHLALWLALMFLSVLGLAAVILLKRRSRHGTTKKRRR